MAKSAKIGKTKAHLERLYEMTDKLKMCNDIATSYSTIKTNLIDPVCYDISETRHLFGKSTVKSRNTYCRLNQTTVSKCTRVLTTIAYRLIPWFQMAGMDITFEEIQMEKRNYRKYSMLCGLFADAEAYMDRLSRQQRNLGGFKKDGLVHILTETIRDVEPDMKLVTCAVMHLAITRQISVYNALRVFLNLEPREPREPQRQSGGGVDRSAIVSLQDEIIRIMNEGNTLYTNLIHRDTLEGRSKILELEEKIEAKRQLINSARVYLSTTRMSVYTIIASGSAIATAGYLLFTGLQYYLSDYPSWTDFFGETASTIWVYASRIFSTTPSLLSYAKTLIQTQPVLASALLLAVSVLCLMYISDLRTINNTIYDRYTTLIEKYQKSLNKIKESVEGRGYCYNSNGDECINLDSRYSNEEAREKCLERGCIWGSLTDKLKAITDGLTTLVSKLETDQMDTGQYHRYKNNATIIDRFISNVKLSSELTNSMVILDRLEHLDNNIENIKIELTDFVISGFLKTPSMRLLLNTVSHLLIISYNSELEMLASSNQLVTRAVQILSSVAIGSLTYSAGATALGVASVERGMDMRNIKSRWYRKTEAKLLEKLRLLDSEIAIPDSDRAELVEMERQQLIKQLLEDGLKTWGGLPARAHGEVYNHFADRLDPETIRNTISAELRGSRNY